MASAAATGDSGFISPLAPVRVSGGVSITIARRDERSVVTRLDERDGHKVRFPRGTSHPEAVLINTGGGLAGGDRIAHSVTLSEAARATVTTQASERVYRAPDAAATEMQVTLSLEAGSFLAWLPQETILFNRSRYHRCITAHMAPGARLLLAETTVFGRTAHRETLTSCFLADQWRVYRDGALVAAEAVRLEGDVTAQLATAAVGNDARVAATMMYFASDAEDRLTAVRRTIDPAREDTGARAAPAVTMAASAWRDRLVVRALASATQSMAQALAGVARTLSGEDVPRVWWT
ncbi:MAG: urease accessory protein UreD [Pseudomonadota bacterium]